MLQLPPGFDATWLVVIAQVPILAIGFWLINKGILEFGVTARRERQSLVDQVAFREQLRQEGLAREKVYSEHLAETTKTLKEATDVMERSTAFNERILQDWAEGEGPEREPRDSTSRTRRTDRSRNKPQGGRQAGG